MALVRPQDLLLTFEPDGRILVKSPSRNVGVMAPPPVAAILSACSQPQTRESIEGMVGPWAGPLFDALAGAGILVSPEEASDTPVMFHNYAGIEVHRRMLQDEARLQGYWNGLKAVVKPGDVVMDAGSGTGVLATMAALCGASKVYALEQSEFARSIPAVAKASGVGDIVEVVRGDFSKVRLPEKCDVMVTETFGAWSYAEDPCPDVSKCAAHNLKPDGIVVPNAVRMWLAPMEECPSGLVHPFRRYENGVDLTPLKADAEGRGHIMITDPATVGTPIDMGTYGFPGHWPISATFTLDAPCEALCCWYDLLMADGVILPTGPHDPLTHWKQSVLPVALSAGTHHIELGPAPEDRRTMLIEIDGREVRLR